MFTKEESRPCLPVDVGRLAEAAGEEKSAKPLMRSGLPSGAMDIQYTRLHGIPSF